MSLISDCENIRTTNSTMYKGDYSKPKSKMNVHFSSEHSDWSTPQNLFDKLNKEFRFDVDVCASDLTAKCPIYYTIKSDGLSKVWQGSCFCNPPYGREISKWIKKAYESSLDGATVVCLIPSRTDTKWWHDYVLEKHAEIRFIRGRLKFVLGGIEGDPAPFPSVIVVFRPPKDGHYKTSAVVE